MASPDQRHILVFVDWFEPGYRAGGPIRSVANLVDRLDDMRFSIITRNNDHHDETPYPDIVPGVWIERNERVKVMYLSPEQRNKDFLSKAIKMGRYDAVYLNSLFSPSFTLLPLRLLRKSGYAGRIVLAPRGMLKKGALSIKARKKQIFFLVAKVTGLFKGVIWHATNDQEKREIKAVFGKQVKIKVAPNLLSPAENNPHLPHKDRGELRLVTVSRVSREKNTLDAIRFLSELKHAGKVRLDVYGTLQDQEYFEACRKMADSIVQAEVHFHGPIPHHEIRKVMREAHFFYLPTLGENFGHAIAEAFLSSTPVLISDKTPWRDLEASRAGWDLKLDRILFGQVLNHCLDMDESEYRQMALAAGEFGKKLADDPDDLRRNRELFRY